MHFIKVKMFIIKSKRLQEGSRYKARLYRPLNRSHSSCFFVKKNSNTPNLYHKTSHAKFRHMGLLELSCNIPKWYFFCVDIFALRTRYGATFKAANGAFFSAPLVEAVKLGTKVSWLRNTYKKFFFLSIGVVARLRFLKLATLVSNIGYGKPFLATARGTYAKLRLIKTRVITLILPSGAWAEMTRNVAGIVGRNAGSRSYAEVLGKASERKYNKKRIIVRSCAKNPVDHPNGGRTRGKRLFKTPWGLPAKANK